MDTQLPDGKMVIRALSDISGYQISWMILSTDILYNENNSSHINDTFSR